MHLLVCSEVQQRGTNLSCLPACSLACLLVWCSSEAEILTVSVAGRTEWALLAAVVLLN